MDLSTYLDDLASRGRYCFTTDQAVGALNTSPVAARAAIRRARARARLATPSRGFHVIVPPEYRALGSLPGEQFVPQLMEHLGLTYYAGLLTAAQLHGAAHQAPMSFQVVLARNRPTILAGGVRVAFVARGNVGQIPITSKNTPRGELRVSTPEATAFDLVGYVQHAAGLSNVATLLGELAEQMDAGALLAETAHSPLPWAQRLGFLLEHVGAGNLAVPLGDHVAHHARDFVLLSPGATSKEGPRDSRWKVVVNDAVEADA